MVRQRVLRALGLSRGGFVVILRISLIIITVGGSSRGSLRTFYTFFDIITNTVTL